MIVKKNKSLTSLRSFSKNVLTKGTSGWTVSDANLTPQKQWLSFHQRNLIGNEILKIKSNQKSSSIKDILKANEKFCFHFHTLHKQNPH